MLRSPASLPALPPAHRPRAIVLGTLLALTLAGAVASPAQAREVTEGPLAQEAALERLAGSGVLYDRVLPLARLEELSGAADAPAVDRTRWRQAWDELRRASFAAPAGPGLPALDAAARAAHERGVLPIALFDRTYDRLVPGSLERGEPRALPARAVAAAVLARPTHRGGDLSFELDPALLRVDGGPPRSIAVDFADGLGERAVTPGVPVPVHYARTGTHVLSARLTRADGSVALARFTFPVAALAAPLPDDTLQVTAGVPWQGVYGTGRAYVALAPGHAAILNPVVVIEGFDIDNSMYWDELYALLDQQDLLETLRADGFDAVVLDFTDATAPIQQNAFVVEALLSQVQSLIAPSATIALVGASMGGLCSRYALADMESRALPHRVRTWISFDAPQLGANIPLGLQYWIQFFAGQSASAADFLASLNSPAARQMLLCHVTNPPTNSAAADPLRSGLLSDLAAIGDWPALPRRVAVANGSGRAQDQGFAPGAQLVAYDYSSLLTSLTGNVWALPDMASGTIFDGRLRILFSTTTQTVVVSGALPWDGAPGGSRASMAQLDSTEAPYGDIVAFHPSHCFVPTVSSLALSPAGPFFDVSAAGPLAGLTPFDAVFWPDTNEAHVSLTAASAAFVRGEIEAGVLAVGPPDGRDAGRLALSVWPSPFAASTRVRFTLPRAARATVCVYGVDGRQVRALAAGEFAAGAHDLVWDGTTDAGARASSGVYWIRVTDPAGTATRRAALLR